MRYGPNLLDEILRRTDIVQLVGRKVKLTRRGQAMWGCCPFHKEKSPSFKVENAVARTNASAAARAAMRSAG